MLFLLLLMLAAFGGCVAAVGGCVDADAPGVEAGTEPLTFYQVIRQQGQLLQHHHGHYFLP